MSKWDITIFNPQPFTGNLGTFYYDNNWRYNSVESDDIYLTQAHKLEFRDPNSGLRVATTLPFIAFERPKEEKPSE